MKTLLAQNMPAGTNAMGNMTNNGMNNNPALAGGTVESRSRLMGLGAMVPAPNIAGAPQQYGASDATMRRAPGAPTPGRPQPTRSKLRRKKPVVTSKSSTPRCFWSIWNPSITRGL